MRSKRQELPQPPEGAEWPGALMAPAGSGPDGDIGAMTITFARNGKMNEDIIKTHKVEIAFSS